MEHRMRLSFLIEAVVAQTLVIAFDRLSPTIIKHAGSIPWALTA
jgi:hypothetical protein